MSAIKILDQKVVKTIDNILESNYKVFEEEKERKQERQKAMQQTEEMILRKMPVTKRMKYLNMQKDNKLQEELKGHWASEQEVVQYRDKTPKMPIDISLEDVVNKIQPQKVKVTGVNYDKNGNEIITQGERTL
jgi:hypothetical protein